MADRILIVDDELEFSEALGERLQARGFEVDTAADGRAAIDLACEKKDYTAIVLDLKMPGLSGIETLERLHRVNPDLQVILLTGYGSVRDSVEAMKLGALDFLEKPADLQELLDKIKTARANRLVLVEKRVEQTLAEIMARKPW